MVLTINKVIPFKNINQLIFVVLKIRVFFEVRTKFLNII
jgi:hypothetical protein